MSDKRDITADRLAARRVSLHAEYLVSLILDAPISPENALLPKAIREVIEALPHYLDRCEEAEAAHTVLLESIHKEHNLILSTVCAKHCSDDRPHKKCLGCSIGAILEWFEEILDAEKEAPHA